MSVSSVSTRWTAVQWTEADALFHADERWRGSDCAYSVDLGGGRVLWIFNDTFIAAPNSGRAGSTMVCNTLAVQRGSDPRRASIDFVWRTATDGAPAAYLPRRADAVMWPGPGAMVGERLLLVGRWITFTDAPPPWGFAYDSDQWWLVDNPRDEPMSWHTRELPPPANPWGVEMGAGSFLVDGEDLLQYCPGPTHEAHLARWTVDDVARGDVADPQWWRGAGRWARASEDAALPVAVLSRAQSEFSVTRWRGVYLQVQGIGTHGASLGVRTAPRPEGPWSDLDAVFTPPESARPEVFCYAFKAHPHIAGDGVVVTYASNRDVGDVADDESLYWPRFVLLRPAAEGTAR
ncbi:MAG: hypothetical protein ACYDAC_10080 [Candidatus Dormibacteria bacterium]